MTRHYSLITYMLCRNMRGGTPHFVLGTEGSIVLGRHYYATASIRRSCFGIVHTFVMGLAITNTFHDNNTRCMVRQLMALYYRHLVLKNGFECKETLPSPRDVANSFFSSRPGRTYP